MSRSARLSAIYPFTGREDGGAECFISFFFPHEMSFKVWRQFSQRGIIKKRHEKKSSCKLNEIWPTFIFPRQVTRNQLLWIPDDRLNFVQWKHSTASSGNRDTILLLFYFEIMLTWLKTGRQDPSRQTILIWQNNSTNVTSRVNSNQNQNENDLTSKKGEKRNREIYWILETGNWRVDNNTAGWPSKSEY